MHQLIQSPWHDSFDRLISQAKSSLVLCSPFIGKGPCLKIKNKTPGWSVDFRLLILTNLSRDNMLSGATDVASIQSITQAFPESEVRFLPGLHAKVYIADEKEAIVTSANMTDSGIYRNYEYGMLINDVPIVSTIRHNILRYAELGSVVDKAKLASFVKIVGELKEIQESIDRNIKSNLRREFNKKVLEADDEILRSRVAGRSPHAIFAEAIKYILASGPASTWELHEAIQHIHPDLCDDSIDRIIDGKHFGKKWKHAVRTAQQYLKRHGNIELVDGKWILR